MFHKLFWFFLLFCMVLVPHDGAESVDSRDHLGKRPIVVIIADKMDSTELFQSERPAIQKLLAESGCGLMNIRSGSGYTNTNSAYLTLGSGNRGVAPGRLNGAYSHHHSFGRITATDFWSWSTEEPQAVEEFNLVVPEIGWIYNQAEMAERIVFPGLLGSTFREHEWQTILIGNVDTAARSSRPGGLLLMDKRGLIDHGQINSGLNTYNPDFPYGYQFSIEKTEAELQKYLFPQNLVVVEFGDFARIDHVREQMSLARFNILKEEIWERFDRFIDGLLRQSAAVELDLVVLSPSLSRESWNARRWLAPLVIRGVGFSPGLLSSATTRWTGLVANLDIIPTLSHLANLKLKEGFSGRAVISRPVQNHLEQLAKLNSRINNILNRQRSLIDWYLGLITVGWGLALIFRKWKWIQIARGLMFSVMVAPLVLILLPMLPPASWQVGVFLGLSLVLGLLMGWKGSYQAQWIGMITLTLWLALTMDQLSGWQLIRFSALGYSPASGSRYYGMGNEYMGIYLAVALLLADFVREKTLRNGPAIMVLAVSVFILGWPRYGINFGGTLAAVTGFLFYGVNLYGINIYHRKLWYVVGAALSAIVIFGIWDALREPELQTHVGAFFRLVFNHDFAQIGLVILRKLNMNLKLLTFSAWTRIILLTALMGVGIRQASSVTVLPGSKRLVWKSILVAGIAAACLNDSGVVALGTCLAYGFSDYLLHWIS